MHEHNVCLHLHICIACLRLHLWINLSPLAHIIYNTLSVPIVLQRVTPTSMPSLSRNGTILLELKRRHVSQCLNELQITLGQMRRCQQPDSKSRDGTRGLTQTDGSATQQEQRKHYPGIDGGSLAVGQRQDSILASQSHSQQTIESFGNHKLESHISGQQTSGTVQSNDPDAFPDCQMLESQDRLNLNVAGEQELNSQITIENTIGHTDIDDMWGPPDQKLDLNVDKCWEMCCLCGFLSPLYVGLLPLFHNYSFTTKPSTNFLLNVL